MLQPRTEKAAPSKKKSLGQYFTPPEVADFMFKMVELFRGKKSGKFAKIIDPACGEGVFVQYAFDHGWAVSPQCIFGCDIDTEMKPRWKDFDPTGKLNLHICDGLLDDEEESITKGSFDLVIGNPPYGGSGLLELGRLWRETGPTATRKFSYDYAGRVAAETSIVAGRTYRTIYGWDKNGNLDSMVYPSVRVLKFTYDLADRIFKITGRRAAITTTLIDSTYYLPFGPDTTMKYGNGIKVKKSFDRRYYTQQITNSVAGKFGRSYQYDHNGNITQLLDLIDNTKSYHSITYDGVDRLRTAFGDFRTDDLTFTYFKNGNRQTKKKGADSTTYNYSNNRLTSTTGAEAVTYQYNCRAPLKIWTGIIV